MNEIDTSGIDASTESVLVPQSAYKEHIRTGD